MKLDIHAGKVLELIKEQLSEEEFSKEQLIEIIKKELKCEIEGITFANCHGDRFNIDELLVFMITRKKLIQKEGSDNYLLNKDFKCGCKH